MRHPLVVAGMSVVRAYDRAGGGMLSGGLSFFAFFTVVPALLLFVSLLGILIEDAEVRAKLIEDLIGQIDPIKDVAKAVVDGLAGSARTGTLLGILGLLWGFSGFYGALQGSMLRMFPGPGTRDFLSTRIRGVLTVILILASMVAAVVLIVVVPVVTEWLRDRCTDLTQFDSQWTGQICSIDAGQITAVVGPLVAIGIAFIACLVVYVSIPPDGPSFRQAVLPALIAGTAIGLLTSLFGFVAPLLVRNWVTLGVVGSVFISLVWFNLVFQAMLYGAAFARLHRDRDRTRTGPPTL
jgi:membrane protein